MLGYARVRLVLTRLMGLDGVGGGYGLVLLDVGSRWFLIGL